MWMDSLILNKWFYLTAIACVSVICKFTKTNAILGVITFFYVSFIGYVGHILVHHIRLNDYYEKMDNVFTRGWLGKMCKRMCNLADFHDTTHHDTSVNRQTKNMLTEMAINFLTQGGILMLFIFLCRHLSMYVVFLWAFAYCTVHIINYDHIRPIAHQRHHENSHTNYGIDIWDILWGTKFPGDGLENINHYAINLILITGMVYLWIGA
jgi:hypothetical protein